MTTIVFRDGILAADRRITCGSSIAEGLLRKARKTPQGTLYACAGSIAMAHKFFEWVEHVDALADCEETPSPPKGEYTGIVITDGGKIMEFEHGELLPKRVRLKFDAWGSGREAALGALHAGASAVEAVRIASKLDTYTGGGIDAVHLDHPKSKRVPK